MADFWLPQASEHTILAIAAAEAQKGQRLDLDSEVSITTATRPGEPPRGPWKIRVLLHGSRDIGDRASEAQIKLL